MTVVKGGDQSVEIYFFMEDLTREFRSIPGEIGSTNGVLTRN